MNDPLYDPIAQFAATLAAHGVSDIVISPGSRSTPLALAFHARTDLRTWIQHDERAAAYFALGQARATGTPSVLICTSGTAAANYLPAVVEAGHAAVPMIVCTADRPPELRSWGAGQTIDQVGLYGTSVRWFADLPLPQDWSTGAAAMTAQRAFEEATGARRGPVHLNWPLREPLEPAGEVPVAEATPPRIDSHRTFVLAEDPLGDLTEAEKGVVILGPDIAAGIRRQRDLADWILRFAESTAWPVFAEPITQLRRGHRHGEQYVMNAAAHLCNGHRVVDELVPEVVVRLGASPTTKSVRQWLERTRPANVVLIDPEQRWHDASFTTTEHHVVAPLSALGRARRLGVGARTRTDWLDRWWALDDIASTAVDSVVEAGPRLAARATREFVEALPDGATVMAANSLPVRDLDWFLHNGGAEVGFVANRGASGIDGTIASALGLASRLDGPVACFLGDIAMLHDLSSLFSAARLGLHLTVLCADNGGGGIFSLLPIAEQADADTFETLFHTPHGIDLAAFDRIAGVRVGRVDPSDDLGAAVERAVGNAEPGVDVLLVPIDHAADIAQRRAIDDAVATALAG